MGDRQPGDRAAPQAHRAKRRAEFTTNYQIRINTEEEVTFIVKIFNEQSNEVVAEFTDEGLEGSTEAVA